MPMRNRASITRRQFAISSAAAALVTPWADSAQTTRPRLRRSESFFGLHFDLHPSDEDKALGRDVSDEMVGALLDAVKPDFVQYDSKGHVGWLGWPSQVGPSAPGIVKDSLEVWRRMTAARGVALYIHFSGVWDFEACKRHPEWARVGPDGKRDTQQTSTFGPYVDELMLRQLREAATKYDLDGAWVDGECWATLPDYYPGVEEAFRKATGIEHLPKSAKDSGWLEFLELNREQFRRYVRHYVEELHRTHPKFQVASNWLYSTFVPEEPTLPVDYLSGDFLGNASISGARLDARYFAQTGRTWDLMAWGFQDGSSNKVGPVHKPAVHLEQEASVVLAQGGGFQVYYNPSRAGWFEPAHMEVMRRVGAFCRERQRVSHRSETVPQIGVVLSRETLYSTTGRLFGSWGAATDPARGWIDALVALQYSVDVLPDWKLARIVRQYPLTVLPEWAVVSEGVVKTLSDYASGGGELVVSGAENAARFAAQAGIRLDGSKPAVQPAWIGGSEVLADVHGLWRNVTAGEATVLERRFPDYDTRSGGTIAAVLHKLGQGEIVLMPGPLGAVYAQTHAPAVRDLVRRLVGPRFHPLVEVTAPSTVEVVLRRKDGRLMVHLLNSAGMQVAGDFAAIDFVPEVGPIRVCFPWRPARLEVAPGGASLEATQTQGKGVSAVWEVELPRLHIHSALAVEPPAGAML